MLIMKFYQNKISQLSKRFGKITQIGFLLTQN